MKSILSKIIVPYMFSVFFSVFIWVFSYVTFYFKKISKIDLLNSPNKFNLLPKTYLCVKNPSFLSCWNFVHYHTKNKKKTIHTIVKPISTSNRQSMKRICSIIYYKLFYFSGNKE